MARCPMQPVDVLGDGEDDTGHVAMLACAADNAVACPGLHADTVHQVWWTADPALANRILELLAREEVHRG